MAKRKKMVVALDEIVVSHHLPFREIVILLETDMLGKPGFLFVGIGPSLFIGNHLSPQELILAAIVEKFLPSDFPASIQEVRELLLAIGETTIDSVYLWKSEGYHFDTPADFRAELFKLIPAALKFCLPVLS
jgi:hypothetical protein